MRLLLSFVTGIAVGILTNVLASLLEKFSMKRTIFGKLTDLRRIVATSFLLIFASVAAFLLQSTDSETKSTRSFDYLVRVQAKDTDAPIQNASVAVEVIRQAPLDGTTDSNGVARFFVDISRSGQPARLVVQATGYRLYTQNMDLRQDTLPQVVRLEASRAPGLVGPSAPILVDVSARSDWVDSGVRVNKGDAVEISYVSGRWTVGPTSAEFDGRGCLTCTPGNVRGFTHGGLIGRIGDDPPFWIGNGCVVHANKAGSIHLRINDWSMEDNTGSIRVLLEFVTPSPPLKVLYQADWSTGLGGWPAMSGWKAESGMFLNDGSSFGLNELWASDWVQAPYKPDDADYVVEAEIRLLQRPKCGSFGIVVREGYQVGVITCGEGKDFVTILASPGKFIGGDSYIVDGNWHKYRVETRGSSMRFIVDGALSMAGVNDSQYISPGKVGLWSVGTQVSVRNFKVISY